MKYLNLRLISRTQIFSVKNCANILFALLFILRIPYLPFPQFSLCKETRERTTPCSVSEFLSLCGREMVEN